MIKIENLEKKFGDFKVLKSVNIHVDRGEIYGLVGSNGSGKTTILKHIMKIYKQDKGEIIFDGLSISSSDDYLKGIYYIQDDLYFPYNYTLKDLYKYEELLYPTMDGEKYRKLLNYFKIDENKKLRSLSKGQKKQAAFIIGISSSVKMLLLDEIVDGLDPVVRKKFWKIIISEVLEEKLTIIISSHALSELDNICDKVGMLHEGIIVKEESIEKLKEETKRVQIAIKSEFKEVESEEYKILKTTKIGSVYFVVLKGNIESFKTDLYKEYDVLLFDELSMNLEEIFITELGGLGYGIEEYEE